MEESDTLAGIAKQDPKYADVVLRYAVPGSRSLVLTGPQVWMENLHYFWRIFSTRAAIPALADVSRTASV